MYASIFVLDSHPRLHYFVEIIEDKYMKKIFELHQRITAFINVYEAYDGEQIIAFIKQKRFALREQFSIYNREGGDIIATSKARSIIDLGTIYDVFDSSNKSLAIIQKDFKKSLISSTWHIYQDLDQPPIYTVKEKSTPVAIFRRLWDFIPIADYLPFPIKFHFIILSSDKIVGEYQKITLVRDNYQLLLDDSEINKLDPKAWIIFAVLLDAMQSR